MCVPASSDIILLQYACCFDFTLSEVSDRELFRRVCNVDETQVLRSFFICLYPSSLTWFHGLQITGGGHTEQWETQSRTALRVVARCQDGFIFFSMGFKCKIRQDTRCQGTGSVIFSPI